MNLNKSPPNLSLSLVSLAALIWLVYSVQFLNQGVFWDLTIYQKAVSAFLSGGDPYALNGYLSFVYQPIVLRVMALCGPHLDTVLIIGYLGSLFFFLRSLRRNPSWWLYSCLAFTYCGIGTIALGSGNITVFLHLVLLGILLQNISNTDTKPSYGVFLIAVALSSLIKPYMAAYFLIPLIASKQSIDIKKTVGLTLLAGLCVISVIALSAAYFDGEFQAFLAAVKGQTLGKRDLGYGLVMYFYDYYLSAGHLIYRAFLLHFIILGAVFLGTLYVAIRNQRIQEPRFVLLLYFLLTIINPRLKVYDLLPALIALFIFVDPFKQTVFIRIIFVLGYVLSLSQLAGVGLFSQLGIWVDPLNVFYLTMGLTYIGAISALYSKTVLESSSIRY
jgi:hypothetical protein